MHEQNTKHMGTGVWLMTEYGDLYQYHSYNISSVTRFGIIIHGADRTTYITIHSVNITMDHTNYWQIYMIYVHTMCVYIYHLLVNSKVVSAHVLEYYTCKG